MNLSLEQQFDVRAPIEEIWAFLQRAEEVGSCMPGVESVEAVGDGEFMVRLAVGIGPVQARLSGKVAIVETIPMESMRIRLEWKDLTTNSTVTAPAEIRLSAPHENGVTIGVRGTLAVVGPLGKYGQPIANRKAADVTKVFAERMQARLEPAAPQSQTAAEIPATERRSPWAALFHWLARLWQRLVGRAVKSAQ